MILYKSSILCKAWSTFSSKPLLHIYFQQARAIVVQFQHLALAMLVQIEHLAVVILAQFDQSDYGNTCTCLFIFLTITNYYTQIALNALVWFDRFNNSDLATIR
jgi:hypothetical protein